MLGIDPLKNSSVLETKAYHSMMIAFSSMGGDGEDSKQRGLVQHPMNELVMDDN